MAAGGGVGATLLAGCTSGESPADDEETTESDATSGRFRLLISDLPADIGDFDRLDVSFDSARVFDGGGDDADDESDAETNDTVESASDGGTAPDGADDQPDEETETDDENGDEADDGTDDDTDDGTDDEEADANAEGVERRGGFYILDLDGATVDLTQVVGDRAMGVFDGELSAGSYNKIELHVETIDGIVDGESVEVKVPSEKLQLTTAFEVHADEDVEFVFDINVVKRGPNNGYILQPVISKSGVRGRDVDVEEVDGEEVDDEDGTGDEDGDEDGTGDEDGGDDETGDETESDDSI